MNSVNHMPRISVVLPAYNEEENIVLMINKLLPVLKENGGGEIIVVDDGSTDNTLNVLRDISKKYANVKYISFSRNFGFSSALRAGIDFSSGQCVITMDIDGQHPVSLIPEMIRYWESGYNIVQAIRKEYIDTSFLKKSFSIIYNKLLTFLSDVKMPVGMADFRLVDSEVANILKNMKEPNLFIRGIVNWLGFRKINIYYKQEKRMLGKTKFSYGKMISLGIQGITSFSIKPLHIATIFGLLSMLSGIFYGLYSLYAKVRGATVSGWTSLICVILLSGGIQMLMLGIIGEYLGKLFIESKRRPNYIVREKNI